MDSIIYDLNDKFENESCEGSGWSLQSLSECIVDCVANHKMTKCIKPSNKKRSS